MKNLMWGVIILLLVGCGEKEPETVKLSKFECNDREMVVRWHSWNQQDEYYNYRINGVVKVVRRVDCALIGAWKRVPEDEVKNYVKETPKGEEINVVN